MTSSFAIIPISLVIWDMVNALEMGRRGCAVLLAAYCIAWGLGRKRNGLLGLLCCVYSNIQIHAFDA